MSECERGKRVLFEQKEVSRSQWVTSFNWIESCAAELLNYYCNIVALNGDLQGQNRYWNWWWAIQKKKKKDEKKKTKCFPWEYQSHSSLAPAFQTNKLLAPLWGRFSTKMPIDTQSNSSLVNLLASPFEMARMAIYWGITIENIAITFHLQHSTFGRTTTQPQHEQQQQQIARKSDTVIDAIFISHCILLFMAHKKAFISNHQLCNFDENFQ